MIDEMIRCKKLNVNDKIESLHEWFHKCPPQGKLKHWKDGRSAKETAKYWLHTIPQPFQELLKSFKLKYTHCSPEFVSKFDEYSGNGRNHDLLILALNENSKPVVVSIESKVDEPFDDKVSKVIKAAEEEKNQNSKKLERIKDLRKNIFGELNVNQLDLKYQLLTAVAGTISEAKKRGANTAIFLIQTFVSDEIDHRKHNDNQEDLDMFLKVISKVEDTKLENNKVLGPFRIGTNNAFLSSEIDLWIGKYEINI